jgi:hypothetical protein
MLPKNLKSFRLTTESIDKIKKIQTDNSLEDETKAIEHIITNYDLAPEQPKRQIIRIKGIKY